MASRPGVVVAAVMNDDHHAAKVVTDGLGRANVSSHVLVLVLGSNRHLFSVSSTTAHGVTSLERVRDVIDQQALLGDEVRLAGDDESGMSVPSAMPWCLRHAGARFL